MIMREDFLWVEKYRPRTVEDTILPKSLRETFQKFVDNANIPNLILLILFYLTLIMPFILYLKEYYKNRDLASLLKVPVGLTYIFFYSFSVIRSFFKK